jgi:hypothetical protein
MDEVLYFGDGIPVPIDFFFFDSHYYFTPDDMEDFSDYFPEETRVYVTGGNFFPIVGKYFLPL